MVTKLRALVGMVVLGTASVTFAAPAVVNFDLTGTLANELGNNLATAPVYTGLGAAGVGGNASGSAVWNTPSASLGQTSVQNLYTFTNVVDSLGNPTNIGLNFNYQGSYYDNSASLDTNAGDPQTMLQAYAYDYFNSNNPDSTGNNANPMITVTGLNTADTYNIYVYTINGTFGGRATSLLYNGNSYLNTYPGGATDTTFSAGVDYTELTNVSPDANGSVAITYLPAGNQGEADFNGVQVVETPEPSTGAALLAAGIGGMLVIRRRRARS